MYNWLKLFRVHHYIKNILIFFPLICGGYLFDVNKLMTAIEGFIIFSLTSSAIYIINDIKDIEKDKLHPKKSKRPIASGEISITNAIIVCILLLIVALTSTVLLFGIKSLIVLLIYILFNLAYSFGLKDQPIIDLAILVSGFVLRVVYGAVITSITISSWLYLTVFSISFYMAMGKRRNELRQTKGETRNVLKYYNDSFLSHGIYLCMGMAIIFYSLWTVDTSTIVHYSNSHLVLTMPLVLLIALKYTLNIEVNVEGDPVEVILHDKILLILTGIYGIIMVVLLYGRL